MNLATAGRGLLHEGLAAGFVSADAASMLKALEILGATLTILDVCILSVWFRTVIRRSGLSGHGSAFDRSEPPTRYASPESPKITRLPSHAEPQVVATPDPRSPMPLTIGAIVTAPRSHRLHAGQGVGWQSAGLRVYVLDNLLTPRPLQGITLQIIMPTTGLCRPGFAG